MTNPLTTHEPIGVALRYASSIIGAVLAVLGTLGWLSAEQVSSLSAQVPELLGAVGALVAIGVPIYATITKSSSDKAGEAAKAIDAEVAPEATVIVKTPNGQPDIVVPGTV